MKATMDKLEHEKTEISSIISEIRGKMLCTSPDRDMIIKYLQKDMEALNNKSPEDLKKIIQTYVEKVLVYQDYVDMWQNSYLFLEENHIFSKKGPEKESF